MSIAVAVAFRFVGHEQADETLGEHLVDVD